MPVNLQPISQTSALILPSTGTHGDVASALAYGIYSSDTNFISGAVDQVTYVYNTQNPNAVNKTRAQKQHSLMKKISLAVMFLI